MKDWVFEITFGFYMLAVATGLGLIIWSLENL